MGIYFRVGKIGFIFVAGEYGKKEYTNTLSQFIEKARTNYALSLTGVTWQDE